MILRQKCYPKQIVYFRQAHEESVDADINLK